MMKIWQSFNRFIMSISDARFHHVSGYIHFGAGGQGASCLVRTQGSRSSSNRSDQPELSIPSSITAEHEELHAHLAKILKLGGRTGTAAMKVEKILDSHFAKETQFAMPPLGLLSGLASGKIPGNVENVIAMTDRLKAEMPAMLREHKEIVAVLQFLRIAAQDECKNDAVQFADALIAHATQEEQILYPSALLVGEYLKLKR